MILTWVQMNGFMLYEAAELRPPVPGLALITGPNGAGKSAIMEAVVWALYGWTVRGGTPVNGGPCRAAAVIVQRGTTYTITREQDGGEVQLQFVADGRDLAGQTRTQTQARIDAIFGTFERFCSTRVFSPEFMARFALATDKERKALLEGVLGLGQFDLALALLRKDLHKARQELGAIRETALLAQGTLQALEAEPPLTVTAAEVADLVARTEAARAKVEPARARVDRLLTVLDAALAASDAAAKVTGKLAVQRDTLDARVRSAQAKAEAAGQLASCPVCLRPLGEGDHRAIEGHYAEESRGDAAALLDLRGSLVSQEAVYADAKAEAAELRVLLRAAEDQARAAELAYRDANNALGQSRANQARAALAEDRLQKARQTHRLARGKAEAAELGVSQLELAEEALGLRGARVLLLGRALARLEAEANAALARLGVTYRVSISGRTTQKSGKEVDAVSVGLKGAGGGEYRGASRGQKTRVDVALLLGLAAMRGGEGILFFDEVMDSLDQEGVEVVARYLGEMAQDRQVVVVSHNEDLQARLRAPAHYRVALVEGKSVISG